MFIFVHFVHEIPLPSPPSYPVWIRDREKKAGALFTPHGHIDSIAAVITTLGLSAAVWLQVRLP
jgi:hypothetical protein